MNALEEKTMKRNTQEEEPLTSLVRRLGNPVSIASLNLHSPIFQQDEVEGFVTYQTVSGCAIVIGDPICLWENTALLTKAFALFCKKHRRSVVYLLASEQFARWAMKNGCRISIQIAEELFIDPVNVRIRQKIRWKMNQSIQQGVMIKEYAHGSPSLHVKLEMAHSLWRKKKIGPQVYIESHDLFTIDGDNRLFYAEYGNEVVGFIKLSRTIKFQGWVAVLFFATPGAPVGVSEHLLVSVFEALAKEDCHYLCLGATSTSKIKIEGLNVLVKIILHFGFRIAKWIFRLDSRENYLEKFKPSRKPIYALFSEKFGIREALAIKKALNVKL